MNFWKRLFPDRTPKTPAYDAPRQRLICEYYWRSGADRTAKIPAHIAAQAESLARVRSLVDAFRVPSQVCRFSPSPFAPETEMRSGACSQ